MKKSIYKNFSRIEYKGTIDELKKQLEEIASEIPLHTKDLKLASKGLESISEMIILIIIFTQ